jgi:hypothetical protein
MRLGLNQRWVTEDQRFFLSSQQRARAAGRSLLPSEPGEAAWGAPTGGDWRIAIAGIRIIIILSRSVSEKSAAGARTPIPALFTRTSM